MLLAWSLAALDWMQMSSVLIYFPHLLFNISTGGWVTEHYRGRWEEFDWGDESGNRRAEERNGGYWWGLGSHGCWLGVTCSMRELVFSECTIEIF